MDMKSRVLGTKSFIPFEFNLWRICNFVKVEFPFELFSSMLLDFVGSNMKK